MAEIATVRGTGFLKNKTASPVYQGKMATVVRVVDGDTIVLESGERVRYIGVDAPESRHLRMPIEPFAVEAAEFNRKMVEGKQVYLITDEEPEDRYGRLLAYIFVGDVFVNARLVSEGYARERAYPPNVRFKPLFVSLQKEAIGARKGIWGMNGH